MLLSFLVYTITAGALAWLGWHANAREQRVLSAGGKHLPFYCWEIVASIVLFAIVAGARYKTGYDHIWYLSQYVQMRDYYGHFTRKDYEIGFVLISKCFALIKAHEFFYFGFWGALQLGLFYFAFRRNKSLLLWLALIIMLGGYFVGWMNTIRQVVVECAFIAMIPMCTSLKRTLVACLLACVCATIHTSALLVVVFLLIMWLMRDVKLSRKTSFIIYGCSVLLGIYPFWLSVLNVLKPFLADTDYQKYIPMIDQLAAGAFRFTTWGPNHVLVVITQVIVLWYYPRVKKACEGDVSLASFYNMALCGMCLSNLFINTSHFVLRPIEYLTLCVAVVTAYTMRTLFDQKRYIPLAILCAAALSITYIAVFKAIYIPNEINEPFLYNILFLYR